MSIVYLACDKVQSRVDHLAYTVIQAGQMIRKVRKSVIKCKIVQQIQDLESKI